MISGVLGNNTFDIALSMAVRCTVVKGPALLSSRRLRVTPLCGASAAACMARLNLRQETGCRISKGCLPFSSILVEEVMSVATRLPKKLGIVLVNFSEVLVMSVHMQKSSIDPAEWHEMRFAVVLSVVAELLRPGAYCAASWTAAMAPRTRNLKMC